MKALLLTFNLLCGADAASTHIALTQHNGVELALPSQRPFVLDGIVAGQAVAMTAITTRLRREHPRLARVILISATAARAYAVTNNLRAIGVLP